MYQHQEGDVNVGSTRSQKALSFHKTPVFLHSINE